MLLRISLYLSLLLTLFISSVLSGPTGLRPTLTEIKRYTGVGKSSGRYLVMLKEGASRKSLISQLVDVGKGLPVPTEIVYEWDTVCNGFAGELFLSLWPLTFLYGMRMYADHSRLQPAWILSLWPSFKLCLELSPSQRTVSCGSRPRLLSQSFYSLAPLFIY